MLSSGKLGQLPPGQGRLGNKNGSKRANLTLGGLAIAASGSLGFVGAANLALSGITEAASGTLTFGGAGNVALPGVAIDATGTYTPPAVSGDADLTLGGVALDATGTNTAPGAISGDADLSLAGPAIDAQGHVTPAHPTPRPAVGGKRSRLRIAHARQTIEGTVVLVGPEPEIAASGTVTPPIPAIVGRVGLLFALPEMAAVGRVREPLAWEADALFALGLADTPEEALALA